MSEEPSRRQPACFIGHGVPDLLADAADPSHAFLRRFAPALLATSPRAIVLVSPFFVAQAFSVTTGNDVELARKVIEHLLYAKLKAAVDSERVADEATLQSVRILFPENDIPVIELSLHASLDPELHFAVGRAIEPLRDEGFLIVGCGSLTYDVSDMERIERDPNLPDILGERSDRFQHWVTDLVTNSAPYARARGLTRFRDHPDIHAVHASGERFLPLLVVAGAASKNMSSGNVGRQVHAGSHRGLSMAAFTFER
jgi:aromatic ring-opening dioxygenase catalytic subunit (LigB family)